MNNSWWKKGILFLIALILYWYSWQSAFSAETASPPSAIELKGYLSSELLQNARQTIETASAQQRLVFVVNASSGDLAQAVELAKALYQAKNEKQLRIVVYIDDQAIGSAALFPFLADELYISSFVSWGDIPHDNGNLFSTNLLRSWVVSLIDPQQPQAHLLQLLAAAMCDPGVRLVDDHGWRVAHERDDSSLPSLSVTGETLVVNHNQLKTLGLVKGVMSLTSFQALYHLIPAHASAPSLALEGDAVPQTTVEQELRKHIVFSHSGPNIIGHLLIDDRTSGISQATWLYIKTALDYYKKVKPIFIILELNTPGGEVYPAQEISDALKEMDTQFNIPVVAFINNWAISAGALLAYSCRFITVVKDGSMGAAEPVIQGESGKLEAASEKVNSAMRADMANRARFFDRNPLLAEAMVDKDMILVFRHGHVVKLENENQIRTGGLDPDLVISLKGKLLTLDASQLMKYGVADLLIPPTKTGLITDEERASGSWPADKMALFHQPFFDEIPQATVDSYRMDWKTSFFTFLASPIVSSLLFLGLLVGGYLEFSTPGFGVAGTIAVTCLFLIILSSFALEIANWLELILLLTGLAVLLVELFVLPTAGLLGAIGVILFLAGLFGMMLPGVDKIDFSFDTQSFNAAGEVFIERLAWLCGTIVIAVIIMVILARFLTPKIAGFSRLVLQGHEQEGYRAVDDASKLPSVGCVGMAMTTLRPAGKVIIDDVQYDAITSGGFIEKGEQIVVRGVDGGSVVVSLQTEGIKA